MGGDTFDAFVVQKSADSVSECLLPFLSSVQTKALSFFHDVSKNSESIGGHGCVIGMTSIEIGGHDLMPLAQIA